MKWSPAGGRQRTAAAGGGSGRWQRAAAAVMVFFERRGCRTRTEFVGLRKFLRSTGRCGGYVEMGRRQRVGASAADFEDF